MSISALILILILTESDGKDDAIGDNGDAVGCLQLHKIHVDEVNRILEKRRDKRRYVHDDRYSRWKSIDMAKIYFSYWIPKECGDFASLNDYLMSWNQGSGWKDKSENVDYIKRFHLKKLEYLKQGNKLAL